MVGRSHECDWPPAVQKLPVCTRSSIDPQRASAEIDAEVKQRLHAALALYEVETATLARLAPDLVLTQTQCEVCAVPESAVLEAVADLLERPVPVVSLSAVDLPGVFADIQRAAAAMGVPTRGATLVDTLHDRLQAVRARVAGQPRPRVACIEWLDPLMNAGNWVPELVDIAGGEALLAQPGAHSGYFGFEALAAADPDCVVLMPCGFGLERTAAEFAALLPQPQWQALRCVRERRVYVTDGNQYFNRPGPCLVESAEILAEILHPRRATYGHHGSGWLTLDECLVSGQPYTVTAAHHG